MTVVLDIHDNYANILTLTAIGIKTSEQNVTLAAVDLSKHNYIRFDENGRLHFAPAVEQEG